MNASVANVIGLMGAAACIIAYLLLQTGRIDLRSMSYSMANGLGAAAILVSLAYEFNMSAFVIEVFWLAISVYGVFTVVMNKPVPKDT